MKNLENKLRADLAEEISELESALSGSYETIQLIGEDGLLDYYAYLIKAYEAKHRYLLKKIKEMG